MCAAVGVFTTHSIAAPLTVAEFIQTFGTIQNSSSVGLLGVVNRPDSPFVTGLGAQSPANSCSPGLWSRGNGDSTRTKGANAVQLNSATAEFGGDLSCFNMNGSGLDMSVGVIGGKGWAVGTAEGVDGQINLDNTFYGLYGTFSSGALSGDLQVRGDHTNYASAGIVGVPDGTSITTDRLGASGSLQYAVKLADDLALIPAIGFDISQTTASSLTLSGNTISLDPIEGRVGYVGATLAKTILQPDGKSVLVPFVTGTYYADFSPAVTGNINGSAFSLNGSGSFGEVSAGVNYAKLLDDAPGGVKQLSATLRVDAKFNDSFTGAGITGQARLQF